MDYASEHWLELWRYDGDAFDEAVVVDGWLPTTGDDWSDQTATLLGAGLRMDPDQGGWRIDWTHANESRLDWPDLTPIAVVARHWSGVGGYTARETVLIGYLHGDGTSTFDKAGVQRAQRSASYAGRWDAIPLPAMQFGKVNLLTGATFDAAKSVAPLATPASEVQYGEYVQQTDVSGAAAIDGNSDTVAVSSLIAEIVSSTPYGNTVRDGRPVPRIAWIYGGRSSRTIGAGNETIAIGVACYARCITWGDMEDRAAVPGFYEEADGVTYPAEKNTEYRNTAFVSGQGRGGSWSLRARFKTGHVNPLYQPYFQWNLGFGWFGLPVRLEFWVKAADGPSVGKRIVVTLKGAAPEENNAVEAEIVLSAGYQRHRLNLDSMGRYGGVMLRFRAAKGEVGATDLLFDLDDLELVAGYSDQLHAVATNTRYFLGLDDGDGHEAWQRVAFDLAPAEWGIPPGGMVIFADDPVAFRAKFDPGDRQVFSLRAAQPNFYFAPGVGRLKAAFGQNPNRFDYDDTTSMTANLDELLFSGLSWTQGANPQGMRRQSPPLTGAFAAVDYPTLELGDADSVGPSYWTYDLGEYQPPTLDNDLTSGALVAAVSDHRHYDATGVVAIDDELIAYNAVEEGRLHLTTRGYNPAGAPFTTGPGAPAAHDAGAAVYPWRNGAIQTGHLVSGAEIRRRMGRARILGGKVLYSNSDDPPSPDPDYERTTGGYWSVFGVWTNQAAEVAALPAPGGYVEARWLSYVVWHMDHYQGDPQRGKVNEVLAYQYLPSGGAAGNYATREVATLADMVGHLLVAWGGLPAAKYLPSSAAALVPIGTTPFSGGSLRDALDAALALGGLALYADSLGYVRLVPTPSSAYFVAPAPSATWALADVRADLSGRWQPANAVAQVRLVAREVAALRVHAIRYPDVMGRIGKILEIKDLTVSGIEMARAHARAAYRQGNARRGLPVVVGYLAGLAPFDRHVLDLGELDQGGGFAGVNTYVESFDIAIERGAQGSLTWKSTISLTELGL